MTDNEVALKNAISVVFPDSINLLCIWHMNKNILKNCLDYFDCRSDFDEFMADWNQVLYCSTEQSFISCYSDLRMKYSENRCLVYLEENVIPFKRSIVAAWTNSVNHLAHVSLHAYCASLIQILHNVNSLFPTLEFCIASHRENAPFP
jgi:hypothetical protein